MAERARVRIGLVDACCITERESSGVGAGFLLFIITLSTMYRATGGVTDVTEQAGVGSPSFRAVSRRWNGVQGPRSRKHNQPLISQSCRRGGGRIVVRIPMICSLNWFDFL